MKKILLITLLFGVQALFAQEDAAIKKCIQTFFDGMYARDTVMIKSVCHKTMSLQTVIIEAGGNKLSSENRAEFYKMMAEISKNLIFEERLLDYKIQQDGFIAQVWTPYEFYVNKKLSHSGNNAFSLMKENGSWKIIYIIDTRKVAVKK